MVTSKLYTGSSIYNDVYTVTLRSTITPVIRHTQHYLSLSLSLSSVLLFSIDLCSLLRVSPLLYYLLCMCSDILDTNIVDNQKKGQKHSDQRSAWRCYVRNQCTYSLNPAGVMNICFCVPVLFFCLSLITFVLTAYYMHARSSS